MDLTAAWQAGRAAWPAVELTAERFAAGARGFDAGALARFPADVYLVVACLTGDATAIATFEREVVTPARGAIAAIDADAAFVDEAVQRLRASLLVGEAPRLGTYAGRGPLRAWVGVAAARTALMMRRSQQRAKGRCRSADPNDDVAWSGALAGISTNNPELDLLRRQYADAFAAALRDAVRDLEPRLRAALRMSFVDALTIDEIGAVYGVHRATAARWIQRACDEVFGVTKKLLGERLALSSTEAARVAALVQSQLDVSLSQLLPAE